MLSLRELVTPLLSEVRKIIYLFSHTVFYELRSLFSSSYLSVEFDISLAAHDCFYPLKRGRVWPFFVSLCLRELLCTVHLVLYSDIVHIYVVN